MYLLSQSVKSVRFIAKHFGLFANITKGGGGSSPDYRNFPFLHLLWAYRFLCLANRLRFGFGVGSSGGVSSGLSFLLMNASTVLSHHFRKPLILIPFGNLFALIHL